MFTQLSHTSSAPGLSAAEPLPYYGHRPLSPVSRSWCRPRARACDRVTRDRVRRHCICSDSGNRGLPAGTEHCGPAGGRGQTRGYLAS
eukprot:761560-Hanusia_phi.AAC.4